MSVKGLADVFATETETHNLKLKTTIGEVLPVFQLVRDQINLVCEVDAVLD